MMWFVALCPVDGQERAEQLQAALERMDPMPDATASVEIDEDAGIWETGGYFSSRPDSIGLSLLAAAFASAEFTVSEVSDEDWIAKVSRDLPPVRAGRFAVHGSHVTAGLPHDCRRIRIDASLAFGTGHHATTQLCLELIDSLHRSGVPVIAAADIGCGTGILAIAAAQLWNCQGVCSDNDPTAVEICRRNAAANGVSHLLTAHLAEGAPSACFPSADFDLVTANILSEPLIGMAPALTALLRPGGRLILSGVTHDQTPQVIEAYEESGLTLDVDRRRCGWSALMLQIGQPSVCAAADPADPQPL